MPLEDTNPRLEAIIQEVKTRRVTMYEGRVPRADELMVAEIERLRTRLALADGLASRLRELVDAVRAFDDPYYISRTGRLLCRSCKRAINDEDHRHDCIFDLAAEIDKELKESPDE